MSLAIAIATAAFFGVFSLPAKNYQFWFSWCWARSMGWLLVYFILAGGGGGLIGWAAAYISKSDPTGNVYLNGFLYGAAGTLALCVDVGARSRGGKKGDDLKEAQSLLAKGVGWIVDWLDAEAGKSATKWLRGLSDSDLIKASNLVFAEIMNTPDSQLSKAKKRQRKDEYLPLIKEFAELDPNPDDMKYSSARAHLVSYTSAFFKAERWAKEPEVLPSPGTRPPGAPLTSPAS